LRPRCLFFASFAVKGFVDSGYRTLDREGNPRIAEKPDSLLEKILEGLTGVRGLGGHGR
jgi:hypothetical protein